MPPKSAAPPASSRIVLLSSQMSTPEVSSASALVSPTVGASARSSLLFLSSDALPLLSTVEETRRQLEDDIRQLDKAIYDGETRLLVQMRSIGSYFDAAAASEDRGGSGGGGGGGVSEAALVSSVEHLRNYAMPEHMFSLASVTALASVDEQHAEAASAAFWP